MSLKKLFLNRRTIRKFSNKKISEKMLYKYIDTARIAPSAANLQPLKYALVTEENACKSIFKNLKWAGYLKGEYNPKEDEEPTAYIAVLHDESIKSPCLEFDAGLSVMSINIMAEKDGVGMCILGSVNREEILKILGLDNGFKLLYILALGYKKEQPTFIDAKTEDIKYYLKDKRLNVPKRALNDVIIKNIK